MGHYRLLHVPDQLSAETYQSIIEEPAIREVLELIKSSTIVIHGIGDAKTMAERRKTPLEEMKKLNKTKRWRKRLGITLISTETSCIK